MIGGEMKKLEKYMVLNIHVARVKRKEENHFVEESVTILLSLSTIMPLPTYMYMHVFRFHIFEGMRV
jgi:hypothetical protein